MASQKNGTLYIGVTNDIVRRVFKDWIPAFAGMTMFFWFCVFCWRYVFFGTTFFVGATFFDFMFFDSIFFLSSLYFFCHPCEGRDPVFENTFIMKNIMFI